MSCTLLPKFTKTFLEQKVLHTFPAGTTAVQQRQKYLGVANGVKAEDFFSYKMNCESCKTIRKCIFPHSLHTAPFCQPGTQTLEHTFV